MKQIKTKKDLLKILKNIPYEDKEQRNEIVCSLIGHSRIQTNWFGYHDCARCGARMGDTLGGIYPFASQAVIMEHNCDKCRENYKKCTWKDKIYVKNPFKKKDKS